MGLTMPKKTMGEINVLLGKKRYITGTLEPTAPHRLEIKHIPECVHMFGDSPEYSMMEDPNKHGHDVHFENTDRVLRPNKFFAEERELAR